MEKVSQSLIIPTRNRSETALAAIASALDAPYPNLQIVVSDNSDDDLLYKELKSRDWLGKLTYHKTESVLSMRDNWERGLDLSTGDLVSVIGDDDAVMPDAFSVANFAFNKLNIDVLSSETAIYKWGSYPFKGRRQYLSFLMGEDIKHIKAPKEILRKALSYEIKLGTGPGLYYGFVKRDFIKSLKAKRGRWIVDPIPDFDSGFATLMYAKAYAVSARALFVQGHSGKSNSGAMRFATAQLRNMETLIAESGLDPANLFAPELNKIKSNNAAIVSSQIRMLSEFRQALDDQSLELNLTGAWNYLLEGLQTGYDSIEFLASLRSLEKLGDDWNISKESRKPFIPGSGSKGMLFEQGFGRPQGAAEGHQTTGIQAAAWGYNRITVNGNTLGFTSILDAVRFLKSVFPTMLISPDADLAGEARGYLKDKNQYRFQQASASFEKGDLQTARKILDDILADDISDAEANVLLEQILLLQDDKDELSRIYSMRFSRSANIHDLYKLLDIYEATGQLSLAEALVEGIVRSNPGVMSDHKISRFLPSKQAS